MRGARRDSLYLGDGIGRAEPGPFIPSRRRRSRHRSPPGWGSPSERPRRPVLGGASGALRGPTEPGLALRGPERDLEDFLPLCSLGRRGAAAPGGAVRRPRTARRPPERRARLFGLFPRSRAAFAWGWRGGGGGGPARGARARWPSWPRPFLLLSSGEAGRLPGATFPVSDPWLFAGLLCAVRAGEESGAFGPDCGCWRARGSR